MNEAVEEFQSYLDINDRYFYSFLANRSTAKKIGLTDLAGSKTSLVTHCNDLFISQVASLLDVFVPSQGCWLSPFLYL